MSLGQQKNKYWVGVLYPENMVDDWENIIGDLLQLPYCYCLHNGDKDSKGDDRKEHLHLIIVFPNTTTYNHALSVFDKLSAVGKQAINTCQPVINIRFIYEYIIHNTETCKKKGKKLYDTSCRISGNNFDIGNFEQVSLAEKTDMSKELCTCIVEHNFTNFADFYLYVLSNYDSAYFSIIQTYSGLFERLTKANYQKVYLIPRQSRNSENTD